MRIIGLASLLFLSSLAIGQTINPDQIRPATSDNQVLTTVTANTPPVWAAGGGSGCTTDCVITDPSTSNRPPDGDQTIVQPSGSMFTLQDSALNGQTFTPTGASGCGIDSLIGCPEFYTQLSQDGSFTDADYNCSFDYQFFGQDVKCNDTEDGYKINYFLEGDTFTVSGGEFDGHAGGALNYDPQDGIQFVSMPGFIVGVLDDFPLVLNASAGIGVTPYIEYDQAQDLTSGQAMAWSTTDTTQVAVNNVSGGTITLPPLSSAPNVSIARGVYQFFFIQTTSSATTLTASAGDTINYGSTFSLSTQGQAVELIGDSFAGNWAVVGAGTGSGSGGSVGTAGQLQMVGSTAGSFAASHATDNGSLFVITEPASITSAGASQWGFTYNGTPIVPGSSTTFVIGANSSGQGVMSETGGTAARICDATNGVCSGSSFITSLTTTGSSGAATVTSGVLNIPIYSGGSSGFPITLGSTSIAASSTTTAIAGMTGFALADAVTSFSAAPTPATFALTWTPSGNTPTAPPYPAALSAVGTFNFDSSTRSSFNNVADSLYVDTESNGNTQSSYGILGESLIVNHNGNANSDSDYGLNEYTSNLGTGTVGEQIGGLFNTQNNAGNVTQSDVIDGAVNQEGAGTITRAHTYFAEATIFSAGAITNNYMFYAQSPNRNGGTGIIGTQYGSYLEQQKVTGVTTGWGYYEAGNDANFLGGALQVTGNLTVNVTGSTQCLEVSSSGVVSGTGTTCGSGSGTVLTITGDGSLINNASSTGGVTLTLGNAAAHKYWGNNTGSTTTPAYESIALADLPGLSANTVLGALTATTPSGLAVPSCSGSTNALTWTSGTGFGCNTISGGAASVFCTVNPQTGTTYTLVIGDGTSSGSACIGTVTMTNASTNTVTIPPNSGVALPTPDEVDFIQLGAGQTCIAAGAGVTLTTPTSLCARAENSTFGIRQITANTWIVFGDTQ